MLGTNSVDLQRLQNGTEDSAGGFICSSCQNIDFGMALDAVVLDRSHSIRLLCEQHQLDTECELCCLFTQSILRPGSNAEDALQTGRQQLTLSSYAFDGLIVDNQASNLFRPVPRAMLFPGRNIRDLRRYKNLYDDSPSGFLGVARTASLEEYFAEPAIAEGPRSHFVQRRYNPALVKTWMQQALEDSAVGRTNPKIREMRLIDCQKAEVVEMQDNMEYFALSYVWHLANKDMVPLSRPRCNMPGKSLPEDIPRVVADAMVVTLDLGYQYLWVDQFCIDQNLSSHILVEHISQMDQVYMSAKLTIVAASTSGALPGVGDVLRIPQSIINIRSSGGSIHDPPESAPGFTVFTTMPQCYESIKRSTWYQRGWCFQESVLSVARLYFTDHETMYQTHTSIFAENYPEPHELLDVVLDGYDENLSLAGISWQERLEKEWTGSMYSLKDPRGRFWASLGFFIQLLGVYTGKDLSYAVDSINGFRGIIKMFTINIQGFTTIAGVPLFLPANKSRYYSTVATTTEEATAADFSSTDESDNEEERSDTFQLQALTTMLLWCHECLEEDEGAKLRRRSAFPSWSWAGWKGTVSWQYHAPEYCIRKDGKSEVSHESEEEEDDHNDEESEEDSQDDKDDTDESRSSSNEDCEISASASSERSQLAFSGWTITAFQCTSGKTVPLEQATAHFQTGAPAQQIDSGDARYLIGEAYLLPVDSLVLMHTLSDLDNVSRLHGLCTKINKTSYAARRGLCYLKACAAKLVTAIGTMVPARLRSVLARTRRGTAGTASRMTISTIALTNRHKYLLSRCLNRCSKLHGILQKLHVTAVYLSAAELAALPRKSAALEQVVREKLKDGSWGLLVMNERTCLVVEWIREEGGAGKGEADRERHGDDDSAIVDGSGGGGSLRDCTRIGLLEFEHFTRSGCEADEDTARIFSTAEKVQFRLG